jgi:hypothetical protein
MFTQNWVGPPSTVLLRRECFERIGSFDEYVVFCNDWDLWIRISKEFDFDYIKEPLVRYYVHKNNMSDSSNAEVKIRGIEMVLKKYDKLFALNRKTYSELHLTLGVLYCFNRNMKKGREFFLNAIKLYPFDMKYYYNLGISLLGADAFKKLKAMRDNLTDPLRSL